MFSNDKKRNFNRKIIFSVISGLFCLVVLCGIFYFNANSRTLSSNSTYNVWPTLPNKEKPTPAPTRPPTVPVAQVNSTGELLPDEAHSIDPETEKAIKQLLANGAPGQPDMTKIMPLPNQYQAGQYTPLGTPTISLVVFEYFLKQGNSPAAPEAASLYSACLKLYCDPAIALAFFQHESSMGTQGAAVENKSWGNIRCTPGFNCRATSGNGSFRSYKNWTEGLTDWVILIRETYAVKWKLYSLEEIIPRYAPSSDNNNPNGYINAVKNLVNKYRQKTF